MIAFAEHEFAMIAPQDDGCTLREHLQSVERQTGRRPQELDGPEMPAALTHVWDWFTELARARANHGFGPAAITYLDIDAWSRLTGAAPDPFEVGCLIALDQAFLASLPKKQNGH